MINIDEWFSIRCWRIRKLAILNKVARIVLGLNVIKEVLIQTILFFSANLLIGLNASIKLYKLTIVVRMNLKTAKVIVIYSNTICIIMQFKYYTSSIWNIYEIMFIDIQPLEDISHLCVVRAWNPVSESVSRTITFPINDLIYSLLHSLHRLRKHLSDI